MRMRAAVSRAGTPHPRVEEVELSEPATGELLVRVVACGVCHTDLNVHERTAELPMVLGHEGAGVVERVGPGVTGFAAGDHVVMSAASHCGVCVSCRRGAYPYCVESRARNFGGTRPDGTSGITQDGAMIGGRFFGQSSFAEHALADARAAVPVPGDLPLELLAPLGCGVPTGAGSVLATFAMRPGDSLAVFGAGTVGLGAVMAARVAGAARIVAVDVVPSRLELALSLGATHAVDAGGPDVVEAVRAATSGVGVTHAFNTTRLPAVFDQTLAVLAPQGTAGYVGPPPEPWVPDLATMMLRGLTLTGIVQGGIAADRIVPLLIDLHRQGRFPFDRLVRRYPFDDIGAAFADAEAGTTVKPVLVMGA